MMFTSDPWETLRDRVAEMKQHAIMQKDSIKGENSTRAKLIDPFLRQVLDFDPSKVDEVQTEHEVLPQGTLRKVDYALMRYGEAVIFVEAKSYGTELQEHLPQLRGYLEASNAPIGILTDGVLYFFFAKHDKSSEKEPFFRFDLLQYTDDEVGDLGLFRKENFSEKAIRESIPDLRTKTLEKVDIQKVREYLQTNICKPSPELARFLAKKAKAYYSYPGVDKDERAQEIVTEAFRVVIEKRVDELLPPDPSPVKIPETPRDRRGIQFDLLAMGIPLRTQLDFHAGGHRAFVTGANTVEYQGKDMKLIDATKPLVGRDDIRPIAYWLYKGCPLDKMYDEWLGRV